MTKIYKRMLLLLGLSALVLFPLAQAKEAYARIRIRGSQLVHLDKELVSDSVLLPPTPLPQGSCVSQAPVGTHGITVCWVLSASATVTGYNVYAGTVTGGPYTKLNTALLPATATSFFYSTANLGGVKQFIVLRSFDGTVESANSLELVETAIGNPLPPTGLQGVAASLRWKTEDNL